MSNDLRVVILKDSRFMEFDAKCKGSMTKRAVRTLERKAGVPVYEISADAIAQAHQVWKVLSAGKSWFLRRVS